jgi:hypothetical protein
MRERKTHKNTHKDGEILQSRKKRWPTTSQGAAAGRKRLATRFLSTAAPIQTRCCCCTNSNALLLLLLLLLSLCIIVIEIFSEKREKKKNKNIRTQEEEDEEEEGRKEL